MRAEIKVYDGDVLIHHSVANLPSNLVVAMPQWAGHMTDDGWLWTGYEFKWQGKVLKPVHRPDF